jgi:hypothetical protein
VRFFSIVDPPVRRIDDAQAPFKTRFVERLRIFDTFPDEAGRNAHLSGPVAAALMEKAAELLAKPPAIEKIDVLAAKLPN